MKPPALGKRKEKFGVYLASVSDNFTHLSRCGHERSTSIWSTITTLVGMCELSRRVHERSTYTIQTARLTFRMPNERSITTLVGMCELSRCVHERSSYTLPAAQTMCELQLLGREPES